ncbi:DcaP family trimeric outer membrane transporter [Halomonas ramblicola]|uniref:DcaP family trimeric outer membrane transporter n=1 Tax=Halomonas ramblicola TaxID=747349 RepID=UPI0025B3DDBA|nr:DcaP family trimeric outer membrane transporter [Halomonas ramblicola]MDN3523022.1 DcaP family trimeric outer membrane transporter [Halomonas ramblicola]
MSDKYNEKAATMDNFKNLRRGMLFTLSSLALAVSLSAQAYEFEVGDTTASIYGYVKLDMIYDMDAELPPLGFNPAIPLDGTTRDNINGHTQLHAKESRIAFATSTPTERGELQTVIEGDFYGGSGDGEELRLRHAYAQWNGIIAGQTWSNFGSVLGVNRTVDFKVQPGPGTGARQSQLRYTTGGFSVALEDPSNVGGTVADGFAPNGRYVAHSANKNTLPDLTLRYMGKAGNLSYGASGVLRQLEVDDGVQDDSALGWGVGLEAEYRLTPAVTLRGSITHGDGIGEYLSESPAAPAYVDPDTGSVEPITLTGGSVGVRVAAGPGYINLGYGYATADLDDAVNAGVANADLANKTFSDLHLNYIWSPMRRVSYGLEVSHQTREIANGDDGDAVRLQGMVMYHF